MSNDKIIITKTNDGYVVELFAKTKNNIEPEIEELAEGISLLEINEKEEEKQFLIYKDIIEKMYEKPIIIKLHDSSKDLNTQKAQLKAILRAAKYGDVSIAFSKIATVTELEKKKEILEECKKKLDIENIPYKKHIKIGTIIEIPSSALMAYDIARQCDYLFIETDSLINYTFGGQQKDLQIQQFQPMIIKLISQAIEGAHDAGIYCGISGKMAEDEIYIPLLIGLGIDEFSLDIQNIAKTRELIHKLDRCVCKELAGEILNLRKIEDIDKKLKQFM